MKPGGGGRKGASQKNFWSRWCLSWVPKGWVGSGIIWMKSYFHYGTLKKWVRTSTRWHTLPWNFQSWILKAVAIFHVCWFFPCWRAEAKPWSDAYRNSPADMFMQTLPTAFSDPFSSDDFPVIDKLPSLQSPFTRALSCCQVAKIILGRGTRVWLSSLGDLCQVHNIPTGLFQDSYENRWWLH